jgi:hypothetical protein
MRRKTKKRISIILSVLMIFGVCLTASLVSRPLVVQAHEQYEPYPGHLHSYSNYYDSHIVLIQQHLVIYGYNCAVDGYYGNQTTYFVKLFQASWNDRLMSQGNPYLIAVDGIVGAQTWEALINYHIQE